MLKYLFQTWRDLSPRKRFKIRFRLTALMLAFIGTYSTAVFIQKQNFYIAFICAHLVLLASLIEFVFSDIFTEKIYPARTQLLLDALDLKLLNAKDGVMKKLEEAVECLQGCDKSLVNATVHLKVNFFSSLDDKLETGLVQLTDYYGKSNKRPWGIISCYKGIIGRCLRTGQPEYVNFTSEQEYEERMIKEFGFTESEMETHSKNARSYFAQPMFSENQLAGVLYLYSTDYQVFPKAINQKQIYLIANDIAMFLKIVRIL